MMRYSYLQVIIVLLLTSNCIFAFKRTIPALRRSLSPRGSHVRKMSSIVEHGEKDIDGGCSSSSTYMILHSLHSLSFNCPRIQITHKKIFFEISSSYGRNIHHFSYSRNLIFFYLFNPQAMRSLPRSALS